MNELQLWLGVIGGGIALLMAIGTVAWAIFRSQYHKTLSAERKEMMEMKDLKLNALETRLKELEARVSVLEAENRLLRELNVNLQSEKVVLQTALAVTKSVAR